MKRAILVLATSTSLAAVAAGGVGCGGDDKKVEYPKATVDGGVVDQGTPVSTDTGQQVGVTGGPDAHSDLTGSAKASYDKGFQAWMRGDLAGARAAFQEAASAAPTSAAPHYSLGCVADRLGEFSTAQQEYRKALEIKSDYELAMGGYAMSLATTGHAGEADTYLADKRAKMPNSARVATYLAEVKSIEKDSGSAQQIAQDALRIDPDFKDAMVTIARDHYRARRMELAKYALQAILDGFGDVSPPRDPSNAEAHLIRGLIYKETGFRQGAFKDFDAAVAKRPDMVEGLIQLGVMKLEAGNSAEAVPLLESATKFGPKSALAHLNLGDGYRLAGRPADAKKEFDQALAMDSSLAVAHYDLGLLYLFSSNIPGTNAKDQVDTAIRELNTFKTMRGPKAPPGQADDVDELINRANAKKAELNQPPPAAAPPATPAATPPAAGAAAGGAPAGGAAAGGAPVAAAKPTPPPAAAAKPTTPPAAAKPPASGGIVRDMP
jgi:Tfp pilus assembly protein PilF